MDDPAWDATVFCKNRDRLLDGDIAARFFVAVLNLPQVRKGAAIVRSSWQDEFRLLGSE
jgi:hypothetical protein